MPTSNQFVLYILLAVPLAVLLSACQHGPLTPYRHNPQYLLNVVQGEGFLHQVIENKKKLTRFQQPSILRVYIEGDGRPWWTRTQVAADPTPRKLPTLDLMALDSGPAIYLGRPCYFTLNDSACGPQWWTQARYSQQVVQSMNRALDQVATRYQSIQLIGHSGGGALAMLMASQRSDVSAVVTLAGNLDIDAWTTYHGYTPLHDSLNPIDFNLPASIRQLHFVGSNDKALPAWLVQQSAQKMKSTEVTIINGADHHCCWLQQWPMILKKLNGTTLLTNTRL